MRGRIVFSERGTPKYYIGDREVSERQYRKAFPPKDPTETRPETLMQTSKAWPRKSDALGVHPKQKAAAEKQARDLGVPTEFDGATGQAILTSSAHQRDLQKALGYSNLDGYYNQICG